MTKKKTTPTGTTSTTGPKGKKATPKPEQARGKVYTPTEIAHALGVARTILHPDGAINWTRASRHLGIAVNTLKKWEADPSKFGVNDGAVTSIKTQVQQSYLAKAKRAREVLLDRMIAVAESEHDLFKLSGAFKIVAEATSEEEVNRALASRISNAQAQAPAGMEAHRGAGGPDPALN